MFTKPSQVIIGKKVNIADIYVYLPATNSVSLVKYEITHDFEKFEIGKHVKANFYNNDINVLNVFENHTMSEVK